jgi:uncharacterized membrane protein
MDIQPFTHSVEDIRLKFGSIKNVNDIHISKLSPIDKLALTITERVGTLRFFSIIFAWTTVWFLWNTLAPVALRFDPFPAFVLWLFISNFIQIHLMPLIMIGQNIQGKHAELRSENDYAINLKAEHEIETVLHHLEFQQSLMMEILKKIERLEEKK